MKIYFFSILSCCWLLCSGPTLSAQEVAKNGGQPESAAPSSQTLIAPHPLPVKQVVLLYEVADPPEMEPPEAEAAALGVEVAALEEQQLAEQLEQAEFQLSLLLHLFSTTDLAKIHVVVGQQPGTGDYLRHSFVFDQDTGLPEPYRFTRDGRTVVLGLGSVKGLPPLFVEVVLEDQSGRRSEVRQYSPE
ncbi:MAG: hypothetical protein AAFW73_10145 [Bacteroidota bacterium]